MGWLDDAVAQAAAAGGVAAPSIGEADRETLLALAAVAAHSSGDRTNAPLLCYALGVLQARGASLDDLAGAVREFGGEG